MRTAKYGIKDPFRRFVLLVEELATHDRSTGYCTSSCVPQHHGGRHAERAS